MGLSLEKDGRDKWNKSGRDGQIINLFLLPCKNQKRQTQSLGGGHWINSLHMVMAVPLSLRTPQSANSTGTRQTSVKTCLCLVAGHPREHKIAELFAGGEDPAGLLPCGTEEGAWSALGESWALTRGRFSPSSRVALWRPHYLRGQT